MLMRKERRKTGENERMSESGSESERRRTREDKEERREERKTARNAGLGSQGEQATATGEERAADYSSDSHERSITHLQKCEAQREGTRPRVTPAGCHEGGMPCPGKSPLLRVRSGVAPDSGVMEVRHRRVDGEQGETREEPEGAREAAEQRPSLSSRAASPARGQQADEAPQRQEEWVARSAGMGSEGEGGAGTDEHCLTDTRRAAFLMARQTLALTRGESGKGSLAAVSCGDEAGSSVSGRTVGSSRQQEWQEAHPQLQRRLTRSSACEWGQAGDFPAAASADSSPRRGRGEKSGGGESDERGESGEQRERASARQLLLQASRMPSDAMSGGEGRREMGARRSDAESQRGRHHSPVPSTINDSLINVMQGQQLRTVVPADRLSGWIGSSDRENGVSSRTRSTCSGSSAIGMDCQRASAPPRGVVALVGVQGSETPAGGGREDGSARERKLWSNRRGPGLAAAAASASAATPDCGIRTGGAGRHAASAAAGGVCGYTAGAGAAALPIAAFTAAVAAAAADAGFILGVSAACTAGDGDDGAAANAAAAASAATHTRAAGGAAVSSIPPPPAVPLTHHATLQRQAMAKQSSMRRARQASLQAREARGSTAPPPHNSPRSQASLHWEEGPHRRPSFACSSDESLRSWCREEWRVAEPEHSPEKGWVRAMGVRPVRRTVVSDDAEHCLWGEGGGGVGVRNRVTPALRGGGCGSAAESCGGDYANWDSTQATSSMRRARQMTGLWAINWEEASRKDPHQDFLGLQTMHHGRNGHGGWEEAQLAKLQPKEQLQQQKQQQQQQAQGRMECARRMPSGYHCSGSMSEDEGRRASVQRLQAALLPPEARQERNLSDRRERCSCEAGRNRVPGSERGAGCAFCGGSQPGVMSNGKEESGRQVSGAERKAE